MSDEPEIEALARQFAEQHRETIRYVATAKRFAINLGSGWQLDEGHAAFNALTAFLRKRDPRRGICAGVLNGVYALLEDALSGPPEGAQ